MFIQSSAALTGHRLALDRTDYRDRIYMYIYIYICFCAAKLMQVATYINDTNKDQVLH